MYGVVYIVTYCNEFVTISDTDSIVFGAHF